MCGFADLNGTDHLCKSLLAAKREVKYRSWSIDGGWMAVFVGSVAEHPAAAKFLVALK